MSRLDEPLVGGEDEDVDLLVVESSAEVTVEKRESLLKQSASLFAFTINYIFGAGILGVPYAVAHGGIVASALMLIISSGFCLLAMLWILEVQERARFLRGTDSVVEYSEMCRMFLGPRAQRIYELALTVFVICSSWMYASIFSVSLSKTLPLFSNASQCDLSSLSGPLWNAHGSCWGDYLIYLGAFAFLMSFVVRMEVSSMKSMQLGLTCFGLAAIVVMICTVIAAFPEHSHREMTDSELYFNAASFGGVFGTFVFAQLCHHGVPLLSKLTKEKEIIRPVFVGVVSTTTTLYLALGVMCAVFFGVDDGSINPKAVNKLITLNWQDYTAGKLNAGFFAHVISFYVRLYPAITCGAAFPLYIITLGNGWYQAYHGENALQGNNRDRYYLGAMAPTILFAALLADIQFMLLFVGISAFVIAFFIPPMMQLKSIQMVPEVKHTFFSGHFSQAVYCYGCLAFAFVALLYTLISQFS